MAGSSIVPSEVEDVHVEQQVERARRAGSRRSRAASQSPCATAGPKSAPCSVTAPPPTPVKSPAPTACREDTTHVDRDQRVGEHGLPGRGAHRAHRRALPRALRAAHADRGRRHAVRADRAPAVRARHARLAVRDGGSRSPRSETISARRERLLNAQVLTLRTGASVGASAPTAALARHEHRVDAVGATSGIAAAPLPSCRTLNSDVRATPGRRAGARPRRRLPAAGRGQPAHAQLRRPSRLTEAWRLAAGRRECRSTARERPRAAPVAARAARPPKPDEPAEHEQRRGGADRETAAGAKRRARPSRSASGTRAAGRGRLGRSPRPP